MLIGERRRDPEEFWEGELQSHVALPGSLLCAGLTAAHMEMCPLQPLSPGDFQTMWGNEPSVLEEASCPPSLGWENLGREEKTRG